MAVDIYFKLDSYPYYDPKAIEVSEYIDAFIQALDMLFSTPKTTVLGEPDFGVNLEQYIWTTNKSASSVRQEITTQINQYVAYDILENVEYDIEVNYLQGEIWDTIVVDVIIDGIKVVGYAAKP